MPKETTSKEMVETWSYSKKLFLWSKSPNFWVAPHTLHAIQYTFFINILLNSS
jgi:hypothetical protein